MTVKKKYSSSGSNRYSCISPELMKTDTLYTFTWNLKEQPTTISKGRSFIYLRDYYNMVIRRLNLLNHCSIKLYPEISSSGRFHFHGTIKINDIALFMLLDLPFLKEKATYEIDVINDMAKWETYIWKSDHIMKPLCDSFKLPYTWRSGDKQVKLDAITALKDGNFSELNDIYIIGESDDEEIEGDLQPDIPKKYHGASKEPQFGLPAGYEMLDEKGPDGQYYIRKKNI